MLGASLKKGVGQLLVAMAAIALGDDTRCRPGLPSPPDNSISTST